MKIVSISSPLISIDELPVDGTIPTVRILGRLKSKIAGVNGKVVLIVTVPRTDLTSPTLDVNVQDFVPAAKAEKSDFDEENPMVLVFTAIAVDDENKDVKAHNSAPVEGTIEAADIKAILNLRADHFKKKPGTKDPKAGKGGKGGKGGEGGDTEHRPGTPERPRREGSDSDEVAKLREQLAELKNRDRSRGRNSGGNDNGDDDHDGNNRGGRGGRGGRNGDIDNSSNAGPVNVTFNGHQISWTIVVCLLFALLVAGGVIAYITWLRETPHIPLNPNLYTGRVSMDTVSAPPALPRPNIRALNNIPVENSGDLSSADDSHHINMSGGKILRPPTATVRDCPPALVQNEPVHQPVWYTPAGYSGYVSGSVMTSYSAGYQTRAASDTIDVVIPTTQVHKRPIGVVATVSNQGTNYAVKSSPAFWVSNDLVEKGNDFRVAKVIVKDQSAAVPAAFRAPAQQQQNPRVATYHSRKGKGS